jgi:glycine betaine/proline transport system ATP-binding protein
MNAAEPKIRVENLIKIYGDQPQTALRLFREGRGREDILAATGNVLGIADVSFEIQEGELFVVMGLSGSGKSTLVRCINRLIAPTSGHVYIDGEDVAHVSRERIREVRRTKLAMVFQRFGLFPHTTVVQSVAYGLKVRGISEAERHEKALEVLESVGLAQWGNYLPASLSGGMQQRVGLARALATDAEILLMDEAFSALDPLIRREMQDELLRLQAELHKTIVFISHDIQEALKIGDRVAVMKDGYIVQIGTPEELITNPANDYIRAFTLDVNRAQVLKTGSIARQTVPVILGQDSVKAAWEQMQKHELRQMYVVNRNARPVGIVRWQTLETAVHEGYEDISKVMQREFPQVQASTSLEEMFHLCQHNLPIAVVNPEGKFKGVVEQSDVLASIGRLTTDEDDGGAAHSPVRDRLVV